MTIFLCGFMGCGKSTIGKALANRLNAPFFDLDDYIVSKEGRTIPTIFEENGEPYFRQVEADSIGEISTQGGVIATGGGAMLNPKTAEFARGCGKVIYLDVPFLTCYKRICDDTNRPLVMNNTMTQLLDLYNKRKIVYIKNSTHTVNAKCSIEKIVGKIIEIIQL